MRIEPSASSAGCNPAHKPPKTAKRTNPRTEQTKKKANLTQEFLNFRPTQTEIKNGMTIDTNAPSQTPSPHTFHSPLAASAGGLLSSSLQASSLAARKTYFPSGFKIFTSSAWMNSLPQITWPVLSGSSSPAIPLTVPPASRTMIWPAAMSQGCRLRSQ